MSLGNWVEGFLPGPEDPPVPTREQQMRGDPERTHWPCEACCKHTCTFSLKSKAKEATLWFRGSLPGLAY